MNCGHPEPNKETVALVTLSCMVFARKIRSLVDLTLLTQFYSSACARSFFELLFKLAETGLARGQYITSPCFADIVENQSTLNVPRLTEDGICRTAGHVGSQRGFPQPPETLEDIFQSGAIRNKDNSVRRADKNSGEKFKKKRNINAWALI